MALQAADPNVIGHTELMAVHPVHPDPVTGDPMEDVDGSYLTQADVHEFHAAGEKAGAWITDSASGWSQFTGYGVDQVTTDDAAGLVNWERTGYTSAAPIPVSPLVDGTTTSQLITAPLAWISSDGHGWTGCRRWLQALRSPAVPVATTVAAAAEGPRDVRVCTGLYGSR